METIKGNPTPFYYKTVFENQHITRAWNNILVPYAKEYPHNFINKAAMYCAHLLVFPRVRNSSLWLELENKLVYVELLGHEYQVSHELIDQMIMLINNPVPGKYRIKGRAMLVSCQPHKRRLAPKIKKEILDWANVQHDKAHELINGLTKAVKRRHSTHGNFGFSIN